MKTLYKTINISFISPQFVKEFFGSFIGEKAIQIIALFREEDIEVDLPFLLLFLVNFIRLASSFSSIKLLNKPISINSSLFIGQPSHFVNNGGSVRSDEFRAPCRRQGLRRSDHLSSQLKTPNTELHLIKPEVNAFLGHQFCMGSDFPNPPIMENDDSISMLDSGKPMSNDNSCPSLE